jgi:hypothetical protein
MEIFQAPAAHVFSFTIDADFLVFIPGSPQTEASIGLSADSKSQWYGGFRKKVNDIEYFYASRLRGEPHFNEPTSPADLHVHPSEPRNARLVLKPTF